MSDFTATITTTDSTSYSYEPTTTTTHGSFMPSPTVDGSAEVAQGEAQTSGFKHKPTVDYGHQINFTIWFLTALSAAFLALRVYSKFLRHRGLWWDDHVLIASWVSDLLPRPATSLTLPQIALVLSCAFVSVSVTYGFGRSLSLFNFKNLNIYLLYCNLAGTFSILAALWSKTSFAITILRISNGWMRWLVWFIIVTVNLSLGVAIALTWGQCTPIAKIWQPNLEGSCWPKYYQIKYNIFTAIYSGAMDIVLALLPWRIIWKLTMNKKEKFGVLVAMSMGVFAGITSIIKITQLPSISDASFTESTTQLAILAAAEGAISIVAASIPILRALLKHNGPPPGPAEFYHDIYTGSSNAQGTGRSSTVISSQGHRRNESSWSRASRVSSSNNKETNIGGGSGRPGSRSGSVIRLSRLSRFSGFSAGMFNPNAYAGGSRGSSIRASTSRSRSRIRSRNQSTNSFGSVEAGDEFEPPPGKIIQTEEVSVEYEVNNRMGIPSVPLPNRPMPDDMPDLPMPVTMPMPTARAQEQTAQTGSGLYHHTRMDSVPSDRQWMGAAGRVV
ncbi:hypothetical protein QBC41DRAFT_258551 [Cercophora samala]|uniref:Rhodopsin domain-containing protein n=1 Tax=Cercophora samala TaxID=330535 RepID=A0AA39Z705_9PEZI|nr:hypothetical protein QBC41DRAFT_258551 [Cercophora samala]